MFVFFIFLAEANYLSYTYVNHRTIY